MEKHDKSLQGKVKKKSIGKLTQIVSLVVICILVAFLGFLVWTLFSYHNHVILLSSRVEIIENEYLNLKKDINVIVESKVETLLKEVGRSSVL